LVNADFPEYTGKKLCQLCADEVFNSPASPKSKEALTNNQEQKKTQTENISEAIADFASLTVFLKENGVIMTAYNCPKCSNMVDIPENGKILICKHCGNPIKPMDIFEKIESLIE
jgi:ribosomal protein S27AE